MTEKEIETKAFEYAKEHHNGIQIGSPAYKRIAMSFYDGAKYAAEHILQELIDKGAIKSWFYNGSYNFEPAIKWHDLRKNPRDFPEKIPSETCSNEVITDTGEVACYGYLTNAWFDRDGDRVNVFAWCEVPRFKKEK